MVVVRGVNIYPSAVEEVLRAEGIAEYRVDVRIERALTELHISVEAQASAIPRIESALTNAFSQCASGVESVEIGSLPRFEAKAKSWIRYDRSTDESRIS